MASEALFLCCISALLFRKKELRPPCKYKEQTYKAVVVFAAYPLCIQNTDNIHRTIFSCQTIGFQFFFMNKHRKDAFLFFCTKQHRFTVFFGHAPALRGYFHTGIATNAFLAVLYDSVFLFHPDSGFCFGFLRDLYHLVKLIRRAHFFGHFHGEDIAFFHFFYGAVVYA